MLMVFITRSSVLPILLVGSLTLVLIGCGQKFPTDDEATIAISNQQGRPFKVHILKCENTENKQRTKEVVCAIQYVAAPGPFSTGDEVKEKVQKFDKEDGKWIALMGW